MLTISLILSAATVLGLGWIVMRRGHGEPLISAFCYSVSAGAVWALAIAAVIHPATPTWLLVPVGHIAFMASGLAISSFLAFTMIFPSPHIPDSRRRWVWVVYGAGIVVAAFAATSAVYVGPDPATLGGPNVRPQTGPLFPLYIGFAVACTVAALAELVLKYRRAAIARERLQLSYLIAGCVIAFCVSILLTLVLPTFGVTRFSTLAPLCMALGMTFPAVAMSKHRLFHLGIVSRQVLVAGGVTLALSIVILSLLTAVRLILGSASIYLTVGLILTAFVTAFLLPTVRAQTEAVVDRYLFGALPADTAALRQLSRELTTTLSLEPLVTLLVSGIGRALRLRSAVLYLPDSESDLWSVQATWPEEYPAWPDLPQNTPIAAMAHKRMATIEMDRVRYEPGPTAEACATAMADLEADVIVPLGSEGRVIGLLVLSEKINGEVFTESDVTILMTLAQQASTALANALLHSEILRVKVHNDNVLRDMSSGVIAVDGRGRISTFNRRAAEILRQSAPSAMGGAEHVLPPELADVLRDARLHGRTVQHHTCRLTAGDGEEVYLRLHSSVLRDVDGETTGALMVIEDETERRHLEEGMQRADRLASLGTLAAGLAHEIKNPLVSIRTLAQLLPVKFDDPEFRESFAHLAAGEVERINDLLERLLVFARPSHPSLEHVQLAPVIDEVLQLVRPESESRQVAVVRDFPSEAVWVIADTAQLRQVFLNLFMNALQAMEDHEGPAHTLRISMRTVPRAGGVRDTPFWPGGEHAQPGEELLAPLVVEITVADTGGGIPDALREDIFNPFFTTKAKGSGLGLSVVARIVRDHGGSISAHTNERGGASFVLQLPARNAQTSPAELV